MALSKPFATTLAIHVKALAVSSLRHHHPRTHSSFVTFRFFSFATPEEAAAERRRRKRRLRIEPPLSSLHRNQQQQQAPRPIQNPNAPKLPEHVSVLTGKRLNLHNRILTLIRENDLEEAALFTRHSVYSNCKPTIFTVNAVLNAQLRQSKYSDLLMLHRFIIQSGIAPNIITHNLIFQTYLDCRKPDTALEHYKQFINDAPLNPSPTTYRILIKGLVDNHKLDKAMELKDEMAVKGLAADPSVYHYLMSGCVRNSDADGAIKLFEELKEKLGGALEDGVVYGCLMKGYFMKEMEKEAMECYEEAVGENSRMKMSAVAYNSVLDALCKNGKFDEALRLFDRMIKEHNPPRRLAVNLGTFNVMTDGYVAQERFEDAIEVFRKMGDYRCPPDTLSFNNLIDQLCKHGMLAEGEEIYGEMDGKGVKPDEYTYVLLMDACFEVDRIDDGAAYFRKMVDYGLSPNLKVYNRLVDKLVKVGKIDEAKSFYDLMVKKLKMDDEAYKFMVRTLSDSGRLDEVLKMVDVMLDDEEIDFNEELQEFVKDELRKEGREEELTKLMEEKERQKAEAKAKEAEAAEAAKRTTRAAVSSIIPSKLFGKREDETESAPAAENAVEAPSMEKEAKNGKEENVEEATIVGFEEPDKAESPAETEPKWS
ncbi:pentatricopeptide repeat-containing protein [Tripterygium wilfordii]|uniref:Pentatricopeptide repeat-containing protein n=1 Tax=Tripterygium wilfordii TaxID=458696 RepID=A0A7J7DAR5_TRIWF|nr:pentatricopeptide repeat-containing protein At3g49240, mitochondrial-like [Tripterygium wilfordii]KAF5743452.1 pentatricopeptide repeat-containing protein [Tripterygium wilfordii]